MDVVLVDARGLRCPLPVLRVRQRVRGLPPGCRVDLLSDDPLAPLDLAAFCAREGHDYLGEREEPTGGRRLALRTGPARASRSSAS